MVWANAARVSKRSAPERYRFAVKVTSTVLGQVVSFLFAKIFLVGQTPWSARDAPVPLLLGPEGLPDPNGPTRGSEGVCGPSGRPPGGPPTINAE